MIIYLDESYDQLQKRFLLLGLLFCPSKELHKKLTNIHKYNRCLDKSNNIIETKYNNCFTKHNYNICVQFINAFIESPDWFSSIIVDLKTTGFDYRFFGKSQEAKSIKKARVYKKFTELIVAYNTKHISNAVFLVDEITRCNRDRYMELVRERFCPKNDISDYSVKQNSTFKHVSSTKSNKPENVRLCVCDLLLGCILNNNLPTKNRWKNKIRKYLIEKLGVKDLLESTWININELDSKITKKYRIWYWKPK